MTDDVITSAAKAQEEAAPIQTSTLTEAQRALIALDLRKKEIEEYYQALEAAVSLVAGEIGLNGYFQAPDGTVYKIVQPDGRYVIFKQWDFVRTKRPGEERGTLAKKEADFALSNGLVRV